MTVYIVYYESEPPKKIVDKGVLFNINSLIFDVMIYHYQGLSIILSSKGYTVSTWVVSLFSIIIAGL